MLHLIRLEPEGEKERPNAFKDIQEIPWWRTWLEIAGSIASIIGFAALVVHWLH